MSLFPSMSEYGKERFFKNCQIAFALPSKPNDIYDKESPNLHLENQEWPKKLKPYEVIMNR